MDFLSRKLLKTSLIFFRFRMKHGKRTISCTLISARPNTAGGPWHAQCDDVVHVFVKDGNS